MFKLSENYEIDRRILKCDYIRFSPAEVSTINMLILKYVSIYLEKILLFLC